MPSPKLLHVHVSRPSPLMACLAVTFALASPVATAATWTVNTCSDANTGSGTSGSLRYAAQNAVSGDTVDMTGLTCSVISLQAGAVTFSQNSLTLDGPGQTKLEISGKYNGHTENDRLINHQGTGTLTVENLSLAWGYLEPASGDAVGGCIYSKGSVSLKSIAAYACIAKGVNARGGAIAANDVYLKYATIDDNEASATAGSALGGGVYASGSFIAFGSTIAANSVTGSSSAFGGGLHLAGESIIISSTISGNESSHNVGGIDAFSGSAFSTEIEDSTISGNTAALYIGGMYSNAGTTFLYNSTIAFNTATKSHFGAPASGTYAPPGLEVYGSSSVALKMQSSLIANNTYGAAENDFGTGISTTVTTSGANNLVRVTFSPVPTGTLRLDCPLLGPLAFNGGHTQTHALLSRSPGIDKGNNTATLFSDQRGPFSGKTTPYPRVSGAAADIGAYEVQQDDVIFNSGFDGCPPLS
jgi:hypothetical protein